jgi:hypothetical protein
MHRISGRLCYTDFDRSEPNLQSGLHRIVVSQS